MKLAGKLFSALKSAVGQSGGAKSRSRTANRFHSARRMQMEPLERRELLSVDGFVGTVYSPTPTNEDRFGHFAEAMGDDLLVGSYRYDIADGVMPGDETSVGEWVQTYSGTDTSLAGAKYHTIDIDGDLFLRGTYLDTSTSRPSEMIYRLDTDGNIVTTYVSEWNEGPPSDGDIAVMGNFLIVGSADAMPPDPVEDIHYLNGGIVEVFNLISGERLATFFDPTPNNGEYFGNGIVANPETSKIYITSNSSEATGENTVVAWEMDASSENPADWEITEGLTRPGAPTAITDQTRLSMAQLGDELFVGDRHADIGATDSGAVYVFDIATDTATFEETWENPDPSPFAHFGRYLVVEGDHILVSAPQQEIQGVTSGVVFEFDAEGNSHRTYYNPNSESGAYFGASIAVVGDYLAIGDAYNSDQAFHAGAVHLYRLDCPGIYVDATNLVVSEDGTTEAEFTVELTTAPTADVTLTLSSSDSSEGSVSTTQLIFTPETWDVRQTVTVHGEEDGIPDNDQTFTIDFGPAVSSDSDYDGYQPASVSVTCLDAMTVTQTFSTGPVDLAIPDVAGRTAGHLVSELEITEAGTIRDLNLQLFITHPQLYGLIVSIESPIGTTAQVIDGYLGSPYSDYADLPGTILDDEAGNVIDRSDSPFDGTFAPQEPLSIFDGEEIQGTWKLHVWDAAKDKITGTLNEWSLFDTRYTMAQAPIPNDAPVAADDGYSVDEDGTLTIDATSGVLANDTDPDAGPDAMTAQLDTPPAHGSLTLDADGSFIYTPDADFNGTDSFTYVANDGQDDSNIATVTLSVTSVADDPVADAGGPYIVSEGGTVQLDASGSTDPDLPYGDALTYAWDLDNDGMFDDATGAAPTFDASGLAGGTVVDVAVQVTDSTGNTSSNTTTVTVQSASTGAIHIADLDGSSSVVNKKKWAASVTILVEDASGSPISNATVNGTWSTGILSTVSTDASGQATVFSGNVDNSVSSVTFTVDSITHATLTYDPDANTDPDGDSSGTSIEVFQDGSTAAPLQASATDAALAAISQSETVEEETDLILQPAAIDLALMME